MLINRTLDFLLIRNNFYISLNREVRFSLRGKKLKKINLRSYVINHQHEEKTLLNMYKKLGFFKTH